jgi:pimeloyl-ACP methyl ester carboxylesterase
MDGMRTRSGGPRGRRRGLHIVVVAGVVAAVTLALGCGDNVVPTQPDAQVPESPFPAALLGQELVYTPCPLYADTGLGAAECADVTVPLWWDDPAGATITLRVKRARGAATPTRQLWMLDGGPGGAGTTGYARYLELLPAADPELAVYTFDHRGTGHSNRLGCPEQEAGSSDWGIYLSDAEWPVCLETLARDGVPLAAYTTTAAAHDVGLLVVLHRAAGVAQVVYGSSYGTYLANRYARLYPQQSSGIILDSICAPGFCHLDQQDRLANDVVRQVFAECARDELCVSKLGSDPWGKAQEVLEKMRGGHCPAFMRLGLTADHIQSMPFVLGQRFATRPLIPAIYYRLDRCAAGDVEVLTNLVMSVLQSDISEDAPLVYRQFSHVLGRNITFSELMSDPIPTRVELEAIDQTLLASSHNSARLVGLAAAWPRYAVDEHHDRWAVTDLPVLMLNGTLDLQTPLAIATPARRHLARAGQRFVTVPWAAHGTIAQSPLGDPAALPCGMQIILGFVRDPTAAPDLACLDALLPLDFNGYGDRWGVPDLIGTTDLWENDAARARPARPPARALTPAPTWGLVPPT